MKLIDPIQHNNGRNIRFFSRPILAVRELELQRLKAALIDEFYADVRPHQHMLHLALNEAEAIAWQSGVPQLVFPSLAREKVQAVVEWHARQQALFEQQQAFPA